jgi:shikimate kinase
MLLLNHYMRLVILYGPPAVGKFTTGQELAKQTGFKLYHNHLTVDDADALFPDAGVWRTKLLETLRYDEIKLAVRAGIDLIFTLAYSGTVDDPFVGRLVHLVESHGGHVYFVHLQAPENVLLKRVSNISRKHIFGKITDPATLKKRLKTHDHTSSVKYTQNLLVDTEHSSPHQSAQTIIKQYHLNRVSTTP